MTTLTNIVISNNRRFHKLRDGESNHPIPAFPTQLKILTADDTEIFM